MAMEDKPVEMAPAEMATVNGIEEDSEARLERLGRERPPCFSSFWSELTFCFSIVMSQILAEYYISGCNILLPTLISALDIPPASSIWPLTSLSLAVTSTLLIFGRLGDMYGGYACYLFGAAWLTLSSILAGFSQTWLMLVICRALQGLALAAFLPSGIMILGSVYRPGPRKNLVFSVYGACAALGFFVGIFFSGLCGRFLSWRWYFFIGGILAAVTGGTSFFSVPSDFKERRKGRKVGMDWLGAGLLVPGLVLLVFAIAGSAHAPRQWATVYIDVCLALGVVLLAVFVYVEGWVVQDPLVTADVFAVRYMKPLLLSLVCLYGSLGIFLLYGALYMQGIMHASPLQIVAWTVPMAFGGLLISTVGGFILHRIPGTILMLISCLGYIGSGLFFALIPENGGYWAFVFPAMVCGTIGIDISFNVTNIFITSNMPLEKQGLAGALINCTLHLGIALHLGFADIVQVNTADQGLRKSYQAVFWFQVALSGLGLVVNALFVRISRAKSDLTVDERRLLQNNP
ncbi:hypothetical protein CFD26_101393 [Aspergillus turcosus]|uniref:Major facilitator superfamily (MFS) profile domain-containing protein n=1 Tax=Aspergillus turcosus TaxID=1245748 RepID=A0A3R7FM71_9EURO|nr:hypothetical protein CFD26_101393 [Aspergillus turcosus]